jgi:predicted transport protein
MSDLQLFRVTKGAVAELEGRASALEKSLQTLIEAHLETFLGVRFLATEFATGKNHGGRIDTLGLDEDGSPVIIEYKRATNENVINQGLFYLDWLLDHRGDFELLVLKRLGKDAAASIDWSAPRLVCIAGDFTKYDEHAVRQINRTIDLIRHRHFGDDLLLIELVHSTSAGALPEPQERGKGAAVGTATKDVEEALAATSPELRDLFHALQAFLLALGDDVSVKRLKLYFAFRRLKNFACVEVQKGKLLIHARLDPDSVKLEEGFTRDMRSVGHYGTGDLQITLTRPQDLERAKELLVRAYEGS